MNILFYSNYCDNCKNLLNFFKRSNMLQSINFICIDNRYQEQNTGITYIIKENGKKVLLPPNIYEVPSLLLVKQNHTVISGKEIINFYSPKIKELIDIEPLAPINSGLSDSLGFSNYSSSSAALGTIQTPPDEYKSNKLDQSITVDKLEQERENDILHIIGKNNNNNSSFF